MSNGKYAIYVACSDNRLEHAPTISALGYKGRAFRIIIPGGAAADSGNRLWSNVKRMMQIAEQKGVEVERIIFGIHPDCGDCHQDSRRRKLAKQRAAKAQRDFKVKTTCIENQLEGGHRKI